jgi:anti-anti-sigma factor
MEISYSRDGDFGILSLIGNMERLPVGELKKGLDLVAEQACKFMIVDLRRVTQLSVSGLGLIFASKNRLEDIGTYTALIGSKRELNRLLPADDMGRMIPLCESVERAKIALRKLAFEKKTVRRARGGD